MNSTIVGHMKAGLYKSLTELEKQDWGKPDYESYLVRTCYQLRKKPLADFTVEDLRIMIGQNISLPYLIPLAIKKLTGNILAEGDFYPGDLLKNVLESDTRFWIENESYWQQVVKLYSDNRSLFESDNIYRQIRKAFDSFSKIRV